MITSSGLRLRDAYLGESGVLTGSARLAEEAKAVAAESERREEIEFREATLDRKKKGIQAQITALLAEMEAEEAAVRRLTRQEADRREQAGIDAQAFARSRGSAGKTDAHDANGRGGPPAKARRNHR